MQAQIVPFLLFELSAVPGYNLPALYIALTEPAPVPRYFFSRLSPELECLCIAVFFTYVSIVNTYRHHARSLEPLCHALMVNIDPSAGQCS